MALSPGTRLGPYEIVAPLGAGGMGEVYRAHDTKLGRDVAIKVLPEAFVLDPDRIERLEREAKVLASLNHPHIAALYGMEQSGGQSCLIMELVEGDTLADRLQRGPLAVEHALTLALQMAEALEAAHEKGVIHRDLKPANVKITPDGKVKVLDFGLAKAITGDAAVPGRGRLTNSPTLSMMATQAGVILGTAAYMSPEQAQGLSVDHRSDVFSFGVVLYEALTGRQPFQGETAAAVLASVLVREADLSALPPKLSPRLVDVLRRCLEKDQKKRWHAVGDLRVELEAIAAAPLALPTAPVFARPPLWKRTIPIAAAALVAAALTSAVWWRMRPLASPAPIVSRFSIPLPEGQQFTNAGRHLVAMSPDGTQMVYKANQRLYLRSMSDLEARPILGTETAQGGGGGVTEPVFSPDGRSVVFYTGAPDQALKRIAVTGGAAVTICAATNPFGMSWGPDGIVFGQPGGIMRVSPNGGKPDVLVKTDRTPHGPQVLPGGQSVLFTLAAAGGETPDWDKAQVVVQSLETGARKVLIEGGTDGRYLPTGHIVYALSGVLFAVPFDARRQEVTGGPVPVVEGVRRAAAGTGAAHFSVAGNGSLIYIPGPASTTGDQGGLALIDRQGAVEPLKLAQAAYETPRMAPDGRRIAVGIDDGKDANIWIYDMDGSTSIRRLTFGGKNRFPVWSADSQRVAYQSDREGDLAVFWQHADGTGTAERLTKPDRDSEHIPESWSPKGDRLLFSVTKGSRRALWMFSLQDKATAPFGAVQSGVSPNASFSPDGRWVAYGSDEEKPNAMYVQPFPPNSSKYQLTGGIDPVWSPDGKELFYATRGGMAAVSVTTQPTFAFGRPVEWRRPLMGRAPNFERTWDITSDGKRFLGVIPGQDGTAGAAPIRQIQVVLNWFEELKARVPSGF